MAGLATCTLLLWVPHVGDFPCSKAVFDVLGSAIFAGTEYRLFSDKGIYSRPIGECICFYLWTEYAPVLEGYRSCSQHPRKGTSVDRVVSYSLHVSIIGFCRPSLKSVSCATGEQHMLLLLIRIQHCLSATHG